MTYRVDPHQPQNVYRDDQYIGVMFTPEDAALVVFALNAHHAALDLADAELETQEREDALRAERGQEAFRKELQKQLRRHGAVI